MNDLDRLSDLNRWAGVVIAVFGSVAVAPSGTVRLWRSVTDWLRQRKHQLRAASWPDSCPSCGET